MTRVTPCLMRQGAAGLALWMNHEAARTKGEVASGARTRTGVSVGYPVSSHVVPLIPFVDLRDFVLHSLEATPTRCAMSLQKGGLQR